MRYQERRGVRRVLASALPDGRTSPNQIPVVDMVLAFFAGVLTGSRRFAHVERLRSDEVVRTILGLARMPSAMTLTRRPRAQPCRTAIGGAGAVRLWRAHAAGTRRHAGFGF